MAAVPCESIEKLLRQIPVAPKAQDSSSSSSSAPTLINPATTEARSSSNKGKEKEKKPEEEEDEEEKRAPDRLLQHKCNELKLLLLLQEQRKLARAQRLYATAEARVDATIATFCEGVHTTLEELADQFWAAYGSNSVENSFTKNFVVQDLVEDPFAQCFQPCEVALDLWTEYVLGKGYNVGCDTRQSVDPKLGISVRRSTLEMAWPMPPQAPESTENGSTSTTTVQEIQGEEEEAVIATTTIIKDSIEDDEHEEVPSV